MRLRETTWELFEAYNTQFLGYEELLGQATEFVKRCEELLGEDRDDSNKVKILSSHQFNFIK